MFIWYNIFHQLDNGLVHLFDIFPIAKYNIFNALSSLGSTFFVLLYFLNCEFKLSIGFVVYINLLISGGYLKNVFNSGQLFFQLITTNGALFSRFSINLSNSSSAVFSFGLLYILFISCANSFLYFRDTLFNEFLTWCTTHFCISASGNAHLIASLIPFKLSLTIIPTFSTHLFFISFNTFNQSLADSLS